MLYHQSNIIESPRKDLDESRNDCERSTHANRRAGSVHPTWLPGNLRNSPERGALACEGVVRLVGNAIDVSVSDMDISVSHPIPSFNTTAPSKIIEKFTRREIGDRFYYNHKKLARKQSHWGHPLSCTDPDGQGLVYLTIIPRVHVGYELPIIISYWTSATGINCFIKNGLKISRIYNYL